MSMLRRFMKDENGGVAVMFSIALLPILIAAGAAVDYSRASDVRTRVQRALDATAILITREPATATDAQLRTRAQAIYDGMVQRDGGAAAATVTVTRTGKTATVAAQSEYRTALMGLAGIDRLPVGAEARVAWGTRRIEVALVLDNTGSMDEWAKGYHKIDELKKAAKELVTTLRTVATDTDTVKISLVPYDTEVRLPTTYRDAPWLSFGSYEDRLAWTGYVIDRRTPYNTNDDAPRAAVPDSLHRGLRKSSQSSDLTTVQPLTSIYAQSNVDTLTAKIDSMKPRGYTNIGLGVVWGLATLSGHAPFDEASADPTTKKVMIVLTDGNNTRAWVNDSFVSSTATIDANTRKACQSAKAVADVYTILLVDGDKSLLQDCASASKMFYNVTNPQNLTAAFKAIADEIVSLRLTH